MSFFTSFQELLDFDQSTNLNGFHFSNSLFGFDSNSIPPLDNLPTPLSLDPPTPIAAAVPPPPQPVTPISRPLALKTPSPIPEQPTPLLETPKQCQTTAPIRLVSPLPVLSQHQQSTHQNQNQNSQQQQQVSPIPIVTKFQLKVTPNNEIYISNESGTFCELAGSIVPSPPLPPSPAPVQHRQQQEPLFQRPAIVETILPAVVAVPSLAGSIVPSPPPPPSKPPPVQQQHQERLFQRPAIVETIHPAVVAVPSLVEDEIDGPIEEPLEEELPIEPETPKTTLFCIEKGIKRPLSPSDNRYYNSGIFRSSEPVELSASSSPLKKKTTSTKSNGLAGSRNGARPADGSGSTGAKLVVSNVINNGLIVNKKHLSNSGEEQQQQQQSKASTPERRIMRPKKKKKKVPAAAAAASAAVATPKVTLEARVEPTNGKIVARVTPSLTAPSRKIPQQQQILSGRRTVNHQDNNLRTVQIKSSPMAAPAATSGIAPETALNFSGIKEKAAQEAIFKPPPIKVQPQPQPLQPSKPVTSVAAAVAQPIPKSVPVLSVDEIDPARVNPLDAVAPAVAVPDESSTTGTSPVELKVVANLVMDKEVFGHISLLNDSNGRSKTVIYQNPVTTRNVIYSILNPKSLNLSLGGIDGGAGRRGRTTATLTLEPHRGPGRKPKTRGRKKKVVGTEGTNGTTGGDGAAATATVPEEQQLDPNVPVSITRSGRLSKPPRYANNFFQNIQKQKAELASAHPPPVPAAPPPTVQTRIDLPAPDPDTVEKLPNFSAALTSTGVSPAAVSHQQPEPEPKRKIRIPLQYRCATCNKIYLGKRMQRHLEKYPSHNSERDCLEGAKKEKSEKDEKSTYLYKHLFDLLQRFTEQEKGHIMLKEISNFVDFVRALIPKLITNDEHNSTVEYIDHNVADVLRLNHGKYRLKLSSLAEEYEKLNVTVNLLNNNNSINTTPIRQTAAPLSTSTPNGSSDNNNLQQSFSFNAEDLNQSSSFPSLSTLMHERNLLLQQPQQQPQLNGSSSNHHHHNSNHQHQHHQQQYNNHPHLPQHHPSSNNNNSHNHHHPHPHHHNNNNNNNNNHHNHHSHHHHHLPPLIGSSCHDDAMNSLSGLCKSPVQHSTSGMVNMALNLY